MNFIKIFGIIFLSLLLSTNAYSKKPLKTGVVFESENGGIYSIKLPMFSGKGRWQPAFDIINNLSQKNCSLYSKDSFLFIAKGQNALTVQYNGKLKVNTVKSDQGLVPDFSIDTNWKYDYFRFFCGKNIEEVLVNHSISNKIFPKEVYTFSVIGDATTKYLQYKNNRYVMQDVSTESMEKIELKLKEINQDQNVKITTNKKGMATGNVAKANFGDVIGKAKKVCKDLGFNSESEKFSECVLELMEISDAYAAAKIQENILIAKAKEQENIAVEFNYETSSGQKITKESKWTKFWQGAAWILYEHGEDILNLALDVKYGTNYSGYNTSNQTSLGKTTRCTGQVIGNVGHVHCPKQYCSVIKSGNISHVICRPKN